MRLDEGREIREAILSVVVINKVQEEHFNISFCESSRIISLSRYKV